MKHPAAPGITRNFLYALFIRISMSFGSVVEELFSSFLFFAKSLDYGLAFSQDFAGQLVKNHFQLKRNGKTTLNKQ